MHRNITGEEKGIGGEIGKNHINNNITCINMWLIG